MLVYFRRLNHLGMLVMLLLLSIALSACTLTGAPAETIDITDIPTNTVPPSRTPSDGVSNLPTALPTFTAQPSFTFPTSVAVLPPTAIRIPTNTPSPISIVILSPVPGNIVAGNVQVLGAAAHPQFLQYQLEYAASGTNAWAALTGVVQTPVINGLLGIWNTNTVPDGIYELRLRVTLRDGNNLTTLVNNVRVQNRQATPPPTLTSVPRPIAAFGQSATSGRAPLVVSFFNQSQGEITGYTWSFGDGGNSTEINPTYTFRTPGIYTVTLTANGPGGSSNVSRQINVQGETPPVAAFTQNTVSGPSPLTVNFTDQSQGTISLREWQFGDGTNSTDTNPSHTFTAVGTYNVILRVEGPGGSSIVTRQITVENPAVPAPNADFNASPISGDAPLEVSFDVTDNANIKTYSWQFGNAGTSSDASPTFTFQNAGTYVVRLVVTGDGGQDNAEVTINVTQKPDAPIVDISASPQSGDEPLAVQFNSNSSGGSINTYAWDFGDGNTSNAQNPQHTFTDAGSYTVRLLATGNGGNVEDTIIISVTQPIAAPTADFSAVVLDAETRLVEFTNTSTGEALSYTWDFGDGNTSNAQNPQHTYASYGVFTVRLTVTNSSGSQTVEKPIEIVEPQPVFEPVTVVFTGAPPSGAAPLTVQFDSSQTTGDIATYRWQFGDGSESTDANPSHTYQANGTYTVTLEVTGADGVTSSAQQTVTVSPALQAAISADPNPVSVGASVAFSSAASTGNISGYAWDFGDGNTSTEANPTHTYATDGNYLVTLTLQDANGGNSSAQQEVFVEAVAPQEPPANPLVAFVSNQSGLPQLYVMNTDGTNVRQVSPNNGNVEFADWSSNDEFVFQQDGGLYIVAIDGTSFRPLSSDNANPIAGTQPVWAPDANQVAFVSSDVGNAEIEVINKDGSGRLNLTNNPSQDTSPSWSPDGSRITFVSDRDGVRSIYVMNADGSNVTRLTADANDESPRWSPDGSRIVFTREQDGTLEIYVMNADGSNATRLTSNGNLDTTPDWSADGSQIVFISDRDGAREVYTMNPDGTNVVRVTTDGVAKSLPVWKP